MDGFALITDLSSAAVPTQMRCLLSGLLATSPTAPFLRVSSSPIALLERQVPLEHEESHAWAGIWRCRLDLDEGLWQGSLHLDAKGHVTLAASDDSTPLAAMRDAKTVQDQWWVSSSTANEASTTGNEDAAVAVKMQIGILTLEGKGTRTGIRPSGEVSGSVLEGRHSPCCVGRFKMQLVMPLGDLPALEAKHKARVNARPAPPLSFARRSFAGRWKILISMDANQAGGDSPPASFALRLELPSDDGRPGTFTSEGSGQRLAGSWGVWMPSGVEGASKGSFIQRSGSALWLKVDRDRCSETLRGIADLPLRESFTAWGKPQLSLEAELGARMGKRAQGALVSLDRVQGRLMVGEVERVTFGMFSLMRDESPQLDGPERIDGADADRDDDVSLGI